MLLVPLDRWTDRQVCIVGGVSSIVALGHAGVKGEGSVACADFVGCHMYRGGYER